MTSPSTSVPADAPAALVRPDDLVAALGRFLRRIASSTVMPLPAVTPAHAFLDAAAARVGAGLVASEAFDPPYRPHAPERLLAIARDLLDRVDAVPTPPAPVPIISTPSAPLTLGSILIAEGAVVAPAAAVALGDAVADVSFLARDLSHAIGPAAVPALFDAAGIDRPDPLRIELWITLRQLLQ